MLPLYVMDKGGRVRQATSIQEWARSFEKDEHQVARTNIGKLTVSTIFMAIDSGANDHPLLFETMVFGVPPGSGNYLRQARYATLQEARRGHSRIVRELRAARTRKARR